MIKRRSLTAVPAAFICIYAALAMPGFGQAPTAPVQPQTTQVQATQAQPTQARPAGEPDSSTVATTHGGEADKNRVAVGLGELSPWIMFQSADLVVKTVMIGLVFASLLTWTIFFAKSYELLALRRRLTRALGVATGSETLGEALQDLGNDNSVMRNLIAAALDESRMSAGLQQDAGIKERAASNFAEIARAEARRVRVGMGALATIAATSPFVGLFGTVWGIMNSFIGISKSQTTNLAVVAPGIAEALLATAIGLVAAIPAVIIYNHFARVTKGYMELVTRASGATARQLSRDLDRRHAPLRRAAE